MTARARAMWGSVRIVARELQGEVGLDGGAHLGRPARVDRPAPLRKLLPPQILGGLCEIAGPDAAQEEYRVRRYSDSRIVSPSSSPHQWPSSLLDRKQESPGRVHGGDDGRIGNLLRVRSDGIASHGLVRCPGSRRALRRMALDPRKYTFPMQK